MQSEMFYVIKLTQKGESVVSSYLKELIVKRKEILDARKDTADDTILPNTEDILCDMENGVGIDEDGEYYNSWGVTDNYNSDYPICFKINEDFVIV